MRRAVTHRPAGVHEVTKPQLPAYILASSDLNEDSDVQPGNRRGIYEARAGQGDPAGLGAGHALGQRGRHDPDDHVGLADLQRLAAVRFPFPGLGHAGRLAWWRVALALRRDVA